MVRPQVAETHQFSQAVELALDHVPASQLVQVEAPLSERLPGSQAVQADDELLL